MNKSEKKKERASQLYMVGKYKIGYLSDFVIVHVLRFILENGVEGASAAEFHNDAGILRVQTRTHKQDGVRMTEGAIRYDPRFNNKKGRKIHLMSESETMTSSRVDEQDLQRQHTT